MSVIVNIETLVKPGLYGGAQIRRACRIAEGIARSVGNRRFVLCEDPERATLRLPDCAWCGDPIERHAPARDVNGEWWHYDCWKAVRP